MPNTPLESLEAAHPPRQIPIGGSTLHGRASALESAILSSASFSIIATDAQGIIQLFNLGSERMLGYTTDEVVDKFRPSDFHDADEVIARAALLSKELDTLISPGFQALAFKASRGIEDIYELTYICKDGSRFPAIVSITALLDDYREIIGYLLIGTHNSVRQRVETELHGAVEIADRANQAKSEFLSNMSHELRTPLGAILGFAQLLESGTPAPNVSQRKSLDQILKAGWYLLDLINEILDLSLIESGKLTLSLEPTSLSEVIEESRALIEPQARQRNLTLHFPELLVSFCVEADRTRLKQVLVNLLSNAVKYNQIGGQVHVTCVPRAHNRVRISVADTGAGLSADQIGQLFQPFNRLDQEGHGNNGTGIGLVVCKRLVELMGGVIAVSSVVGSGSVFSFDLPVAIPRALPVHPRHVAADPVGARSESATLLYVEDNPANLMLVEDLISRRPGIRLLSARDGNEGVELALSALPDLILMDINLPGISGLAALRLLQGHPATARIPVIALSANASARDISRGIDAGFYRYLTKPIRVDEFLATLDTALSHARRHPATPGLT